MKVHLIKQQTIVNFTVNHAGSRSSFDIWMFTVKRANWHTPEDMLCTFGSADLLGNGSNRVVFDIGGNNYRMICKYAFGEAQVHLFICWIGTHAEYSVLCKAKKQYTAYDY